MTIRGVSRKPNAAAMKVNAQVLDTESGVVFADGVDMMSARSRGGYARAAAAELGPAEGDLRRRAVGVCWRWSTGRPHRGRRTPPRR